MDTVKYILCRIKKEWREIKQNVSIQVFILFHSFNPF